MARDVSGGLRRGDALKLLAGAVLLPSCSKNDLSTGSKNFTEALIVGNMYADLLEHSGLRTGRKLDLGGTQVAMSALQRGDIDLYPEYTGTAWTNVLKRKPLNDPAAVYKALVAYYRKNFDLVWLTPAPMNNTQALASTQATAARYRIRTLSELGAAAPQLRLGAIPEFTKRADGLPGLQRAYGGFNFKNVSLFDIGVKYRALESGDVDVVVAFGTDGQILADKLVVFEDDKHFWPRYEIAPVVRATAIAKFAGIPATLNRLAPLLTDDTMRRLNAEADGKKREPADVAHEFLVQSRLV